MVVTGGKNAGVVTGGVSDDGGVEGDNKLKTIIGENNKCTQQTCLVQKHGKVTIVGNGMETYPPIHFTRIAKVEVNEASRIKKTRKIFKRKSKFGRVMRKKNEKKCKTITSSVPSSITLDVDDKSSVSSITTSGDAISQVNRNLARTKKQVKNLKDLNKQKQMKIEKLTKELNLVRQQFTKEKKVSNFLIQESKMEVDRSRNESAKVTKTNKCLTRESKHLKESIEEIKRKDVAVLKESIEEMKIKDKAILKQSIEEIKRKGKAVLKESIEEMKIKEKTERINIIRKERLRASRKLHLAKQSINKEKQKNNELITTLKNMKEDQIIMYEKHREYSNELSNAKKIQEELNKKVQSQKHKLLRQQEKQYNERKLTNSKCKEKDNEIHDLKETLFEISDEILE